MYSSFKDNIWCVDLADMQLINKYKKNRYLLRDIDLFSKYAFVVPLEDKKGTTIVNAFQSILNNSKEHQIIYGFIKVVSFITLILKNG